MPDPHDPMYMLDAEAANQWPKYIACTHRGLFLDGVAFIRCDRPLHSAGVRPDLSIAWERQDDGFDEQMMFGWARWQVSPLWAFAVALEHNTEDQP